MSSLRTTSPTSSRHRLVRGGKAGYACLVVLVALVAGFGWLDVLRSFGGLRVGPALADALPLRALAGSSTQPLARVTVAWVSVGLGAGLALAWSSRRWRLVLVGVGSLVLLGFASDAARAVEETQNLGQTLSNRMPGLGVLIEACLFTMACAVPGRRGPRAVLSRFR